ncbi:unnamed protein product [Calypogeia fissa]
MTTSLQLLMPHLIIRTFRPVIVYKSCRHTRLMSTSVPYFNPGLKLPLVCSRIGSRGVRKVSVSTTKYFSWNSRKAGGRGCGGGGIELSNHCGPRQSNAGPQASEIMP